MLPCCWNCLKQESIFFGTHGTFFSSNNQSNHLKVLLSSGSDGASTPGSNSWGDMFGAVGPVTRSNSQWTSSGDLGYGSNNVFLDPPRGDTYFDTWAACDALLETEKAFGDEEANDFSEHWNKFHLKARPQF